MAPPIEIRPPCPTMAALAQARADLGWPLLGLEADGRQWFLQAHTPRGRSLCRIDLVETSFHRDPALPRLQALRHALGPRRDGAPQRLAVSAGYGLVWDEIGGIPHTAPLVACAPLPGPIAATESPHQTALAAWAAEADGPDHLCPSGHGRVAAQAIHPDLAALLATLQQPLLRLRVPAGHLFFLVPPDPRRRLLAGAVPS